MREDDLLKFRWIADPRISPDGTRVAFTLVHVDAEEDEYRTDLWLATVPVPGVRVTVVGAARSGLAAAR